MQKKTVSNGLDRKVAKCLDSGPKVVFRQESEATHMTSDSVATAWFKTLGHTATKVMSMAVKVNYIGRLVLSLGRHVY